MKNFKKFRRITTLLLSMSLLQAGLSFSFAVPSETTIESSSNEENTSLINKYENLLTKNEELSSEKLKLMDENSKLKQDQVVLQHKLDKSLQREKRYRKKLKEKKDNLTPEQVQNKIDEIRAQTILECMQCLGEYKSNNPSRKMKNVDMKGLFSNMVTLNIRYTNKGDTTLAPLAVKATAKGTVAGGAAITK